MSRYLLDANVFIQAKNLHYGLDFCPAFWEWLITQNGRRTVVSIDKVGDELASGGDELSDWASTLGASLFLPTDNSVLPSLPKVSTWASTQQYESSAVSTFLQVADYWLVAYAHAHGLTVVTHEKPADSIRKIKIPNACLGLGISCITPFEMLQRERARFVLGQSNSAPQ